MNILPSFSPYPSSSLPLTKTGKKGTARDNEQKKSKIMVAEGESLLLKLEFHDFLMANDDKALVK